MLSTHAAVDYTFNLQRHLVSRFDARQRRRGPVKPPLKRARRISITIGSVCAARSIEVSGNDRYGASCSLRPSLEGLLAEPTAGAQLWW